MWGENDPDTPISDAHIMEELMPNAALVVIEGAGHYSFLEQPALFKNIIRSYLELDKKPAKKSSGSKTAVKKKSGSKAGEKKSSGKGKTAKTEKKSGGDKK